MYTVGPRVSKALWLWRGEFVAALWQSDDPNDKWQYLWAPVTPLPSPVFRPQTLSWWFIIGTSWEWNSSKCGLAYPCCHVADSPDSTPCHPCTCTRRLHLRLISYQDRKSALPLPVLVHSPGDNQHWPAPEEDPQASLRGIVILLSNSRFLFAVCNWNNEL